MYKYDAKILRIVDGDTVDVEIDLGFKLYTIQRCRLEGINTPESRTKNLEEKALGLRVKKYLIDRISGKTVLLGVKKQGKFGRYLIIIWMYKDENNIEEKSINQELIDKGFALEYHGGKKIEFNRDNYKIKE